MLNQNNSLSDEFNLVVDTEVNNDLQMNSEINSGSSKSIRHSNKTKELLLKLITDEKLAKINEQENLENKMKSKEENFIEYDSAIELAGKIFNYLQVFQFLL